MLMDCFSFEQVLELLRVARAASEDDWLLLATTFLYALRASEAVGLKGNSVVGDHLVLSRGKGSRSVRRPLFESENPLLNIKPALRWKASLCPKKQLLFPISARTLQRKVKRYGKAAGLDDLLSHPHTLRHSLLSHLVEKGMDIRQVQEISGHKDMGSLGIYLHPKSEKIEQEYRRALDR